MKKKTKGLWIAWLLVLPVVIVRASTTLYPIIMTFINSTYDMSLLKGTDFQFIGLGNYIKIFSDQKLLSSIHFTVISVSYTHLQCCQFQYLLQKDDAYTSVLTLSTIHMTYCRSTLNLNNYAQAATRFHQRLTKYAPKQSFYQKVLLSYPTCSLTLYDTLQFRFFL